MLDEEFADRLARPGVVDTNLGLLGSLRQYGIDGDNRNAGRVGSFYRRHDAVGIDRDHDDAVDLLLNVCLDGIVLCCGIIVRIEDHKLGAGGIGCFLRTLVHLGKEQGLLVDLHQGNRRLVGSLRGQCGQNCRQSGSGTDNGSATDTMHGDTP